MHTSDRRFLRLLALYALALLLLHLLVSYLPASWAFFWYPAKLVGPGGRLDAVEWLWGVYPYTTLPLWLGYLVATISAIIVLYAGFSSPLRPLAPSPLPPFPRNPRLQILLSIFTLPLFYLGRVVHTRWGDAYLLVKGIAHPDVRLTYNWQAPLDIFVHARFFQLGERLWGWTDAMPAYWWLSSLAGAVAVWVLLRLASEIGRNAGERWAIFGIMATLGAMQLFFGYPENYTIISLLILIYLWLGWRFVQGKTSLWAPSIILALAHAFHPATLILQPSLWVLAWWASGQASGRGGEWTSGRKGERARGRKGEGVPSSRFSHFLAMLPALLLPPIVIGAATFALMTAGGRGMNAFLGAEAPGGGDHSWLVPLTTVSSDWEYYTQFSRGHFIEIVNQQLLVMPFTLPLLLVLALGFWRRLPRDGYALFLITATLAYVLLTWVWNPDYGGQRDWDLFAPAAWPATLLAVYWLTRVFQNGILIRSTIIIVTVQFVHTLSWVYSNTRPWEWPSSQ